MARIDFHSNVSQPLDYACRLIRKALAANCKLIVCHQDQSQLAQLDQALWEFSATDFLPHLALNRDNYAMAQKTPVWLALANDLEVVALLAESGNQHSEIAVNLSLTVPAYFDHCQRLIEIVPPPTIAPEATQAGRERYRWYQQQGHQLNHINAIAK
jgi:DNA polymerase-3 subunit chi